MNLAMLALIAAWALSGGALAADLGGGSPTVSEFAADTAGKLPTPNPTAGATAADVGGGSPTLSPPDDLGGGSPTHP